MSFRNVSLPLFLVFLSISLSACEKPEEKEARYLRQGNAFFQAGDYVKARLEYKNAARSMPTDAEPRYRLGLVDEAENDVKSAFANYTTAEQQNPHFRPALLRLAQYFLTVGQYEQAQTRIDIALADARDDPETRAVHAALLLRLKQFPRAEAEALFAHRKDPGNITAISVLTGVYSAEDEKAKAAKILDEGIAQNPKEASLLILKAVLYSRWSDLDKVVEAYRALFALKPQDRAYREDLAAIYIKAGKPQDAEAALRAGVAAMPEDWEMKRDLVQFLGAGATPAAAEQEIHAYMQANPGRDELYFWLADLYISHHETEKAVALLRQIIAKDGDNHLSLGARTSLARIQFVKGDRKLAQELVNAVLERDPGNQDALIIHAHLLIDAGYYEEAIASLRTLVRDHPHNPEALQLMAEIFLTQGHQDLAIDTQNQLLDLDPANVASRVRLAQMYGLHEEPEKAMRILSVVTKNKPDDAIGWESTARIAINNRQWDEAASAIDILEHMQDQRPMAAFLKGQLLYATDNPDAAITLYNQVIAAAPDAPLAGRAATALVQAYEKRHRMPEAIAALQALPRKNAYVYTLLGNCLLKLNKPEESAQAFDKAIAQGNADQEAYAGRAQIDLLNDKPQQALRLLQEGREKTAYDVPTLMMMANLFARLDRPQETIALYEDMLAHNPGLDPVANNAAQAIADYQPDNQAALEKARLIAERFVSSANPLYLDTLSWIYYRQGRLQEAQVTMARVMASENALPPEVHYHYGCLLLALGQKDHARKELTLATQKGAYYPGVDTARKLLANL